MSRQLQYVFFFFNYSSKFKEIEINARRFSRDFPKFVTTLSAEFGYLPNLIIKMNKYRYYLIYISNIYKILIRSLLL